MTAPAFADLDEPRPTQTHARPAPARRFSPSPPKILSQEHRKPQHCATNAKPRSSSPSSFSEPALPTRETPKTQHMRQAHKVVPYIPQICGSLQNRIFAISYSLSGVTLSRPPFPVNYLPPPIEDQHFINPSSIEQSISACAPQPAAVIGLRRGGSNR